MYLDIFSSSVWPLSSTRPPDKTYHCNVDEDKKFVWYNRWYTTFPRNLLAVENVKLTLTIFISQNAFPILWRTSPIFPHLLIFIFLSFFFFFNIFNGHWTAATRKTNLLAGSHVLRMRLFITPRYQRSCRAPLSTECRNATPFADFLGVTSWIPWISLRRTSYFADKLRHLAR